MSDKAWASAKLISSSLDEDLQRVASDKTAVRTLTSAAMRFKAEVK